MFDKILTPEEIREEAGNLSSFDGEGLESFEGDEMDFYTGEGDDLLSFEGDIQNFAGEGNSNTQFTFTLANGGIASRTAVIWAGYLKGNATLAPGQIIDGAFNDTNGDAGLTGSSNNDKTIAELFAYLEHTPSRAVAMKLTTTNASQVNNDLTIEKLSPFGQKATTTIRPREFQDQNTFQLGVIQMPVNLQFDNYTKISYPVINGESATITFFFGASVNVGQLLKRRSKRAKRNISLAGPSRVIRKSMASKNIKRLV